MWFKLVDDAPEVTVMPSAERLLLDEKSKDKVVSLGSFCSRVLCHGKRAGEQAVGRDHEKGEASTVKGSMVFDYDELTIALYHSGILSRKARLKKRGRNEFAKH